MQINIRQAEQKDLSAIIEMLADDELGKTREDFQNPLPKSYIKAFKTISEDKNQELMVIENQTFEIIGTLQLTFIQYLNYQGGIRVQIESVHIKKEYQGQGLGKKLFTWCIERAKERNARILQLTSDKKRPRAIQFYKDLGFVDSHEGMKMHFIN